MKIMIFGATGTIGKQLVNQSLDKGYEVYVFSRRIDKMKKIDHPQLHKIEGDVFNLLDLNDVMPQMDAVIITLGAGKNRNSIVRSQGTKNIIKAMNNHGVKRLICQTTLGAGESEGNLNLFWKYIMFGWFLKQVFRDHQLQEEYVKQSSLDWTIVRPAAFIEGEKTEKYRHGFSSVDKSVRLKISRADVADFILKQLNSSLYLFKTPGVSY